MSESVTDCWSLSHLGWLLPGTVAFCLMSFIPDGSRMQGSKQGEQQHVSSPDACPLKLDQRSVMLSPM